MEGDKSSGGGPNRDFPAATISGEASSQDKTVVLEFFKDVGVGKHIPHRYDTKQLYSTLIGSFLKVHRIQRGRISCIVSVKPAIMNFYGGVHGAAVAALAEMVSIACARTVVGKEKEIFLGELSISYLAAAPENAELILDGSVVRSGRNLTVTEVAFRLKESKKLTYTSRATFYNLPVASL